MLPVSKQSISLLLPRCGDQLVPRSVLTWLCRLSSRRCCVVVFLLLVSALWWVNLVRALSRLSGERPVSAPWWVSLFQRLVKASWWERLLLAHWWMELGLGSLVGRAVSRVMSIGDHRLRKSLGSLSANEWPVLWPPDGKNWLIGKDPDAGKDWRQEEKGMTEDEMFGWHHRLDGHGFE